MSKAKQHKTVSVAWTWRLEFSQVARVCATFDVLLQKSQSVLGPSSWDYLCGIDFRLPLPHFNFFYGDSGLTETIQQNFLVFLSVHNK